MHGESNFAICEAKKRGQVDNRRAWQADNVRPRQAAESSSLLVEDLTKPKPKSKGRKTLVHDLPRVHSITGTIEKNDGQTSSESGRHREKKFSGAVSLSNLYSCR
ncbi:hypothetical protein WN51_05974 [Melipona quadrifasciata]|uniref:Uncharacterized protein n=1 Tax=Melipona quadrifasciata TaxID=166423 RepID=A0A0M9A686_9HYME|nr:hypothetical protein WN51_05974 [Melipona quadrifasciata]